MDFGSFNLENANDVLKSPYALPTTTEQQQQPPSTTHAANVDFLAFAHSEFGNGNTMSLDLTSHPFDSTSYGVPQLTPDGRDRNNCTNSSVLTGHNPDYAMSPLQISQHSSSSRHHHPHPMSLEDMAGFGEDELQDFLSPLVSPAIAPAAHDRSNHAHRNMATTEPASFSPLTSPALHSVSYPFPGSMLDQHLNQLNSEPLPESVLQQKLALIEQQQQLLRTAHRHLHPQHPLSTAASAPSATQEMQRSNTSPAAAVATASSTTTSSLHMTSQAQKMAPPPSSSAHNRDEAFIAPATPSLLMKLGRGGGTTTAANAASVSASSAVDNMGSLPAAMLEDRPSKVTGKKAAAAIAPAPKRRKTSRASAAFTSPGLAPTHHMLSPRPNTSDPTIAALVSPAALRPHSGGGSSGSSVIAAASSSPRALKPLISPSLKPNGKRLSPLEEQAALAALATKSNYQNMREGNAKSLGIDFSSSFQSGVENRRSAHKAAEQKRRDILKQSFDSLRKEIADALVEVEGGGFSIKKSDDDDDDDDNSNVMATTDEEKEKAVKQMSKVVLIQHAYEFILKLKGDSRKKDDQLKQLRNEIQALQQQLDRTEKGPPADTSTPPASSSSSSSEEKKAPPRTETADGSPSKTSPPTS